MKNHPNAGDLETFLQGSAPPEVNRLVVRHLLAACTTCRTLLAEIGWGPERLERIVSLDTSDPEELPATLLAEDGRDYDQAFANAWRACKREIESPAGTNLQAPPDDAPEDLRLDELLLGAEDSAPEPRLVEQLLARSHAVRYESVAAMLRWARVARLFAERCAPDASGGEVALADLRARAWGQFGNALRVAGRLREAGTALERASDYAARGSGDRELEAKLLSWIGSLRIFERRFDEAVSLIDQAADIRRSLGQEGELAWCLSNRAIAAMYSGQTEAAIRILDQAMLLSDHVDPRLDLAILHNLIYCYVDAGRLQEALALFPQARSLGEEIDEDLLNLRLVWQEGRILNELGMLEEAEAHFSRARDGFLERDLAYEASVVALDLAAVYVKLGLNAEVRRTVGDILPVFSSLRVGREVLAALIRLQKAEDQEQALQLIRVLSRELVAGHKLPHPV